MYIVHVNVNGNGKEKLRPHIYLNNFHKYKSK